jgi:hypothetical protein
MYPWSPVGLYKPFATQISVQVPGAASAGCKGYRCRPAAAVVERAAGRGHAADAAQAGEQKNISKKTAAEGRPRSTFRAFFRKPPVRFFVGLPSATL